MVSKYLKTFFLTCLLFSLVVGCIEASNIRVRVLSRFHPQSIWVVALDDFTKTYIEKNGKSILVNGIKNQSIIIGDVIQDRVHAVSLRDFKRSYKGSLEVTSNGKELIIINELPISEYLMGVLPAEIGNVSIEALKAQTVLARTLAYERKMSVMEKGFPNPYDLVDLTIDQAYSGYNDKAIYRQAITATHQLVITSKNQLITSFYHSTCGDTFYTPEFLWGGPKLEYLRSGKLSSLKGKHLCKEYPHYVWKREISVKKIQQIIGEKTGVPLKGSYPKRIKKQIKLDKGGSVMPLEHFRLAINRVLGWHQIKSNDYQLVEKDDSFYFAGFGLGHNIGLCQCEAIELGKKGVSFRGILNRYFKNIQIQNIDELTEIQ